ncbi:MULTISPECIES: phage portal protein [Chromobacterium]|uniref:Phage portal protein n=1 Tax=Chromobacterium rhizoryzae TaxID=1778675 RepID=A0AAD0RSJ2_9NEIS|nr:MULTISPECIES: phage portal protein [Chromobacterium]AXT46605.1 phage portal protein [Chromobacterium rhizoryzae]
MFSSQQFGVQDAANPERGWISSLMGAGARSASGVRVSPEKALALTTLQSCVTQIAESVAQLPCELYRRDGDSRIRATDHPVYRLIRHEPNQWQTAYEFREQQQVSAGLRGAAYSFIERDEAGYPVALLPLDPTKVQVLKGQDLLPYYRIGSNPAMPMRMIHHVRWFTLNGYTGVSPVQLHCDTIGLALATQDHASMVFANGTHLAGVLERPAVVGQTLLKPLETDRVRDIKDAWRAEYSGSSNAMKVAVLQDGMSFRPLSMTNEDAQLLESRKLSALEVAQIYKMPLHKVNLLDRATNNNIEHQAIEFVVYCLMPWLRRHEQAMMRDLLLPNERDEYYIEFNVGGLLRGDTQTRYAAYAVGRQWGWLSVNDIRRLENLPPIPGGDIYLQPLNMVHAGAGLPKGAGASVEAIDAIHKILETQ